MQSVSTTFTNRSRGAMRPLSWHLFASFPRVYKAGVDFFTIGVSVIGGADIIKGSGNVINEWDKYQFDDYSYRVLSLETTRQEEAVNSVALAMGDVKVNNHDNYFTPNAGSPIDAFLLPYRPMKIYMGFGGEDVPVLIGLTEKVPTVDEKSKTATFHVIDFMSSLFNRPLETTVMLQNVQTDAALTALMTAAGIVPAQYSFDTGFNIISFVYFEAGTKFGDAVKELMEAEMGRFYMDETGTIRFKNRQNFSSTPVMAFDSSNILQLGTSTQDDIINVVEIKSSVREVQANQKFWEQQAVQRIPPSSSIDIWANFDDPVTTVDSPTYITSATTSLYATNTIEDGSGSAVTSGISFSNTQFAKSYKMTISNANAFDVFITALELFAKPARVVRQLYVRESDTASVAKYDERVLTIENNFISNEGDATSKAKILLGDYAANNRVTSMTVKGNPALQIGDAIYYNANGQAGTAVVSKIVNKIMGANFTQQLNVKVRTFQKYFTIGVSTIGGTDVIAP